MSEDAQHRMLRLEFARKAEVDAEFEAIAHGLRSRLSLREFGRAVRFRLFRRFKWRAARSYSRFLTDHRTP